MIEIKVVGVSFENRQANLERLQIKKERVRLIPEPENKFDKNAIKVETHSQKQLGYVPKELARTMKLNGPKYVSSYNIYGGGYDKHYGMSIKVDV